MDTVRQMIEAIADGDVERVRLLIARHPALAHARDEGGVSMILHALYYGRPQLAEEFLAQRGPDDLDLFEAIATARTDRVRTLLADDPALANAFTPDGFPALGLAAFLGRVEIVDLLLASGAVPDAASRNAMRVQPLHGAVTRREPGIAIAIAQRLLAAGAPAGAAQDRGYTPLHAAAQHGDHDLVMLLLRYGADPAARTDDGLVAADVARDNGHKDIAELLRTRVGLD